MSDLIEHDRNKDGAIEFIDAVVRNEPIWPNPWGQDVAFVAFVIHSDRQRIAELEAQLAEWEKLKDPINLHVNLLRGVPCRLDRMQHLLHLAGATDYDYLKAANAKMRKCLESIAEHHKDCLMLDHGALNKLMQLYHTERRDFALEAAK